MEANTNSMKAMFSDLSDAGGVRKRTIPGIVAIRR
jgi:hypothetical protein